ncbi:MAG: pyridoxamine 5'-phosphate oxidase [Alphaproteobacteria bacterium]|nr:pyridoxamine 5'-phosphate oxidase [Alphaproteobacteria bacterium]
MDKSSLHIPATPSAEDYAKAAAAFPDDSAWFARTDPFALFVEWLQDARASEPIDPNAMALATADELGAPDVRMVLLKDVSPEGFVFYTNSQSRKGLQIEENPVAALCFHWKSLRRQVRISGRVSGVSEAEADAYFASRTKDSQIGAWASDQSRAMGERVELERKLSDYASKYGAETTPRPPHWKGYRVAPSRIEFWRDGAFRLHDRLEFTRATPEAAWVTARLYP